MHVIEDTGDLHVAKGTLRGVTHKVSLKRLTPLLFPSVLTVLRFVSLAYEPFA